MLVVALHFHGVGLAEPALECVEDFIGKTLHARQRIGEIRHDDFFQAGGAVQHFIDLGLDFRDRERDHHIGLAVVDLAAHFLFGIKRVEVHNRRTGLQRAVIGDHIKGRVRQAKANMAALAETGILQTFGEFIDFLTEFFIRQRLAHEIQRGLVGVFLDRVLEHLRHRGDGNFHVPVDIHRIFVAPRILALRLGGGGFGHFSLFKKKLIKAAVPYTGTASVHNPHRRLFLLNQF